MSLDNSLVKYLLFSPSYFNLDHFMKLVSYKTKFKSRRLTCIKHPPLSSQNAIKQLFKLKLRFEYIKGTNQIKVSCISLCKVI